MWCPTQVSGHQIIILSVVIIITSECTMGMEEQQYSQTELAPKLFVEQTCKTSAKTVPHIKKVSVNKLKPT